MADSYEILSRKSLATLKAEYDALAPSTSPGLGFLRDEIARREADEFNQKIATANQQMLDLTIEVRDMTASIKRMTLYVLVLTVGAVAVTAWGTFLH